METVSTMQAPADQVPEGEGLLDRVMTAVQTHIRENGLQVGAELPSFARPIVRLQH
jgi:GntR family transcriptional regulator, transcriptional repressor for pyruvate dehydrogenase complex